MTDQVATVMTPAIEAMIVEIIEKQEGGWILTHNANDPDGGWTFAGITAPVFTSYMTLLAGAPAPYHNSGLLRQGISTDLANHTIDVWKTRVLDCYFHNYYLPCAKAVGDYLNYPAHEIGVEGWELSAFINCGPGGFHDILMKMKTEVPDGDLEQTGFLRAWMAHYIELTVNNACAWREFAAKCGLLTASADDKPTTFRAPNLLGWFRRVEYWREKPETAAV